MNPAGTEMISLQERVAFVTGANSGIGKASALRLAEAGARVACAGRDEQELAEVVQEIHATGGEAIAVLADITNLKELESGVRQTLDRWGRLDILVANAGINGVWAPITDLKPEEWEETLRVNLTGTFYTIRAAVPALKKQGGSIIIVSSVNGTRIFSNTGATAYATSKVGQLALGQMLALELSLDKIRVNVVCPGAISTSIEASTRRRNLKRFENMVEYPQGSIPLTGGEPGEADTVADVVLFLASDLSRHVSGSPIWVDGAESLLEG